MLLKKSEFDNQQIIKLWIVRTTSVIFIEEFKQTCDYSVLHNYLRLRHKIFTTQRQFLKEKIATATKFII